MHSIRPCLCFAVAIALAAAPSPALRAEAFPDDERALNVLFGNDHLSDNVLEICTRAATLSREERFEFLADWVLPGDHRSTFRLDADFTPTDPAPVLDSASVESGFRVPTGGEIISPALDLIDNASVLGRLDEVRQRVEATRTTDVGSRIDRTALLAMIDMARDDLTSAQKLLAEVFALVLSEESTIVSEPDALLLCVHRAAGHPSLCQAIVDPTYQFTRTYQIIVDRTVWQRQFTAAYARVHYAAEREKEGGAYDVEPTDLARWHPASLPRARRRGAGVPVVRWFTASGYAENLSSHDEDFLYYASPLRGDFEVECDIAMFGWHESEIFFAGKWVRSSYNHHEYKVGGFTGLEGLYPLDPPLTEGKESIHYRSVVHEGVVTTYVQGRRIHERPLPAGHDPWLAIHSAPRHDGPIRNLRLTGDPVIPDEIRLTTDRELDGWIPYFDEVAGADWQYRAGEIHAACQSQIPTGCHRESALFYHRPMLEDGSIEYEFWFEPGVCQAHPVLDRLCFVLDPDGVKLHWLTDGLFDRTSLSPDNLFDDPDDRWSASPLPLVENDWNRLRLTVSGDTVELSLNGERVYHRNIERTNQRHFGLFHYADRAELRVRNVVWRGVWPRELPELDAQQLVIDETGFLDERLPELTDVFSHDFTDGLPQDRFGILERELPEHISVTFDGLHTTRSGNGEAFVNTTVAPALVVSGDFDMTASFTQFATEPAETGSNSIFLMAVAETGDHCRLFRRHLVDPRRNQQVKQVIVCSVTERNGERFSFFSPVPMEAPSGTLRLARRGATVYYLWAENDSLQFRLIDQVSFPADDLPLYGVRLKVQTQGEEGTTSVTWKNLTVRAERLSGPAVDNPSPLLNSNREQ